MGEGACTGPHFFLSGVPSSPTLRGHKRQPWHGDRLSDTLTQPLNHRLPRPSTTFLEILYFSLAAAPFEIVRSIPRRVSVRLLHRFDIAVIRRSLSIRFFFYLQRMQLNM